MNPKHYLFVDERLLGRCAFCGGTPDTKDHVPSKILLDEPLPPNLPIVESCAACNQASSLDEEYLACFVECVLAGSAEPAKVGRPKVQRSLEHNPKLAARIQQSAVVTGHGAQRWVPEYERIVKVITKLARGHVAYELSEILRDDPTEVICRPLSAMSNDELEAFERAGRGEIGVWPEIGSRAFLRITGAAPFADAPGPWVNVQFGRYRYAVDIDGPVRVQLVISEYLSCVVIW